MFRHSGRSRNPASELFSLSRRERVGVREKNTNIQEIHS